MSFWGYEAGRHFHGQNRQKLDFYDPVQCEGGRVPYVLVNDLCLESYQPAVSSDAVDKSVVAAQLQISDTHTHGGRDKATDRNVK